MAPSPEDGAATFCATLVDEWVHQGVTDAVIAPGSRSTPLALALADEGRLRAHVHHDERSAGFMALGLGLASDRPAVVLTTSGTAAVELHPAVVEAHHARVPLIACTADRPPELRDVGAPQTIDQTRLYGVAARWFAEPGVAEWAARRSWRSLAARSVAEATGHGASGAGAGPVHLNLAFRDPLVGTALELPPRERRLPGGLKPSLGGISRPSALTDVFDELAEARNAVVVAGRGALQLAAAGHMGMPLGWPVLADPRSGVTHDGVVTAFDAILRHEPFAAIHRPEAVLRLGEPPASKVLAQWLAEAGGLQVAVGSRGSWPDPDHTASVVVDGDGGLAHLGLLKHADRGPGPWLEGWMAAQATAMAAFHEVLREHSEPTEPATARAFLDAAGTAPSGADAVVASSMPIRDVEWYGQVPAGVRVLANRGANGIDGVVSTAVGVALTNAADGSGRRTLVLVGDVALLHDGNALLGLARRDVDLTIVCCDNDGGGIFSFLPQRGSLGSERFEHLFGTPHGVDLAGVAAVHGIPTDVPTSSDDVAAAIADAVTTGGVRLILVRTDRDANVAVHEELHRAVARRLDSL